MATVKTVDFLPEIFQTDANRQFLAATLDQLVQEPRFKKTQGFIGRRVGPGVNPNDRYVVEIDSTRTNYQLEPGVISLQPDTDVIRDAITYPGLNDAITFQGGQGTRPDRLYQSEYYTWDPFVDFDTFVNFSQYFWLPDGPDAVDIRATGIPISADFEVTRDNGVYTFSGISGENPIIDLVRGGNYTFSVAQNNKETVNFRVKNSTDTAYVIDGQRNPTLTLARGNTYVFNITVNGTFPFWIKTQPVTGSVDAYNDGVLRNGSSTGLVTFTVPRNAPDTLYYIAGNRSAMQGQFNIVDSVPGTGPGFWIQSAPGVSGTVPSSPNISSRDVFGVSNNGEDLGTVIFNAPYKDGQSFYYNLTSIESVDLLTTLKFSQINNIPVTQFIETYGGIDGITDLNQRTLVFTNPETDAEAGGWEVISLYDPLVESPSNNGLVGSFDTTTFSQVTPVPPESRYQIWQINYTTTDNIEYITLQKIIDIDPLEKWAIKFGAEYSNTQWYKDVTGFILPVPLLSAAQDVLYYQDGTDPDIFGRINLVEQTEINTIFIDEILGRKTYTAPNGVVFTNGLKVKFTGDVSPASFGSNSTTINYTATESGTNYITAADDTDRLYVGQRIVFNSPSLGGLVAGQNYFVRSIAASGIKFTVSSQPGGTTTVLQNGTGNATAVAISNREYYVAGVGTAIELLPVTDFVVPEIYANDFDNNTVAVEPEDLDYLTIDRASKDLNAWTRSNRWFHIDVINSTATYNDTVAVLDNTYRAKRPILQFRPGLKLWNMGTQGKQPVDIIDFEETDAFSNIEGSTGYSVNGYTFVEGTRVIFAADNDSQVRNKIYVVSFVIPDSQTPLISQPIINLTLATDGDVLLDQSTVVLAGDTTQGKTYWYDGVDWIEAQQKAAIQQAPLFNVYDGEGVSFGDTAKYQSSNFTGSKLFSYAVSDTTLVDPVLQFPLEYLNIENVGDIVFENNLYVDSFVYVVDNASVTLDISSGAAREYATRTTFQKLIGWQNAVVDSQTYQQFRFGFNNQALVLDVAANNQVASAVPVIKIYVGAQFLPASQYTYTTTANTTEINLLQDYAPDEIIEVLVLSDQTSKTAFYQVPINLESNPLNANSPRFTLGTVRTHYQSICENLTTLTGPVNGANNTRDLGNLVPYGLVILQQSAPLTLAGYFMRSKEYNIFAALKYNSQEYLKYKAQLMDAVLRQNISFKTNGQILDDAIQEITLGKVDSQPFYWSDMLPTGIPNYSNSYEVGFTTQPVFDTVQVYNFESSNYLGLLVYVNGVLLTRGVDYTVAIDGPRVTIDTPLVPGDVVVINEYSHTYGSFAPNTPTKLGLYPAWQPDIVPIKTSNTIVSAILGHDGSITPLYGDLRDQILLEFETRIYDNLKLDGNPVPLTVANVLPGQFRDTGFTYQETNNILGQDFLSYCGWNKLDFRTQQFNVNNTFTYNYSSALNRLDNQPLLGGWRGIYRFTYDTQQPQYTPWEMLGFSVAPDWWADRYGPAPYTSDNLVLWDDLEAGYVADPVLPYYLPDYARPGLTEVIPTGSEGDLLPPNLSVMGFFNETQFQKSWAVGDGGPVEASWWNSSAYPFAVMRLLALTRTAKFFALFADRDRYRFNLDYQQYLYDDRYRLDANGIQVYGNGVSKASYINWIVDYNRVSGLNSTDSLTADLTNLDVRLCYRMASFSDKQYIKIITEKSSPSSTNTALVIPDESYDLLVYKNQPFGQVIYSSVTIQRTASGGYSVTGYSTLQPFFNVFQSRGGRLQTFALGTIEIQVPTLYSTTVTQIPYGTVFTTASAVVDFLLSYGKYLESQGLTFTNVSNGYVLDWPRMGYEFLYWAQQGWSLEAILNLNPLADKLTVTKEKAVVDSIRTQTVETQLLDQNSQDFATRNLNIVRIDNTFTIQSLVEQIVTYAELNFTSFEHIIVLSNQSVFGDLIYDPTTGDRQSRLNLIAVNSVDWNGTVNAPGFILNQNNVEEWTGLKTYTKGEIVRYKNVFWSALTIVQPSTSFNFNDWVQSDYEQIQLGLLPNIANKADQLANSYNINSANIETDNDLLSYGLIGYRPRQYMAALNLDDVSQINVYRQFLGSKGTVLAAELFKGANFSKETADYDIYENWAVQRAVYGANANRSFVELRLNRGLLNSNPSIVKVTTPQETSEADQNIQLGAVWRQSYKLTSPAFLPVTSELPTDIGLPNAGYVSLDDADITIFDIEDNGEFAANLDNIEVGTSIWVAKINQYDWNIYRAQPVPGTIVHVCDNLDTTSRVVFSSQHGLSQGQKLIIKQFDIEVDGVYTVVSVLNLTTVNIEFQFLGDRTVADGDGIGFTLQTQRVAQASDVLNLPYANEIQPGARVWTDDDGTGHWAVFEKQNPFAAVTVLNPDPMTTFQNENYGHSVTQAQNRTALLVGAPFYTRGAIQHGGVYVYVKSDSDQYTPVTPLPNSVNAVLTLDVTGVRGYGNAVDFGNKTWAVAGASRSLGPASQADNGYAAVIYRDPNLGEPGIVPFAQWQLLTQPGTTPSTTPGAGEFGYSVAMSTDERWMYIGTPGISNVHAYGRVDWEHQFVMTTGDGVTDTFYIADEIQIDQDTQIVVTLDGTVQFLTTDYTVDGTFENVTFVTAPAIGVDIRIQRINQQRLDYGIYYGVTQSATSGGGAGAVFTIERVRGQVGQPGTISGFVGVNGGGSGYAVSNTITINATNFDGGVNGVNNITLTVTGVSGTGALQTFTIAYTPPALQTVFNLGTYFFTATNIDSFSVLYEGVLLRPNIDYSFNTGTLDLTFTTIPSAGSAIIVRAESYFRYVSSLQVAGLTPSDRMGTSVSTSTDGTQILCGSPNSTVYSAVEAGTVYVFDRNVQRFIVNAAADNPTFTVLGLPAVAPVGVTVNNERWINQVDSVIGGTHTFTWDGSNGFTLNGSVNVGDEVLIETNNFTLLDQLHQQTVAEFSNFGSAVDLCENNCSVYVGEPNSSVQIYKGGIVERSENQSRIYGTITSLNPSPALTNGHTLRVNNIEVPVQPDQSLAGLAAAINSTVPNVTATVSASTGLMTLTVTNSAAADPFNKLNVAPGSVGTAFDDIGFDTYVWVQNIVSPYPVEFANFGSSLSIDTGAENLVVGAPRGTLYLVQIFDDGTTIFDVGSTVFFSVITQSGAVYTYDFLPSANPSVLNPGNFVFGQQLGDNEINEFDLFGYSVNYTSGVLTVGAPASDLGDSSSSEYGSVSVFVNPNNTPAWQIIKLEQPVVDVRLLNSVFLYDRITSATTEFLDFIDPLQGKILGAARQNIDYIGAVDPAAYNAGILNNTGATWGASHVGEIWWDTATVRFIDPNQDSLIYASRRWSQVFPGSSVSVYQWIKSDVLPADYTGEGTPKNINNYSVNTRLSLSGLIETEYYFWVQGITVTATNLGKTLPASTVANYILDPKASGIAYLAAINSSTVSLYNCLDLIEAQDTILHIEYDRELTSDNVHVEYDLVPQDRADGFVSDQIYRKMQDSFCGVDTVGNLVPDPNLGPAERYGIQFRPRQSMFVDRFEALRNYLSRVNSVVKLYPIVENRTLNLLLSSEPKPSANSGLWNLEVANLEILGFQNIDAVPLGYRYLVDSDSNNGGRWTIYQVQASEIDPAERLLVLYRVQNFVTPDYWQYIDWYLPGYNSSQQIVAEIANVSDLESLDLPVGSSVKLAANSQGKFEIYQLRDLGWIRVGLEDGTIEFKAELWDYELGRFGWDIEVFDAQYFDQEPVIETRKIIQGINQELFVDDLAIERNRLLILVFNFVLSEFGAPEWLVKTSLIDVDHRLRDLVPFQNYIRDNQEFVEQYIQEVKPYHVQIREFNLKYQGVDDFLGDISDFDLPAYFNTSLEIPEFTSPILLPYAQSTAFNTALTLQSDTPANSTVWQTWPYSSWYQNYLLNLDEIEIVDGGDGYNEAPTIEIVGDAVIPATATCTVNSLGHVVSITITTKGVGYLATPEIVFVGGNGTGARAYARMTGSAAGQNFSESSVPLTINTYFAPRIFRTTIRFDRNQYVPSVVPWSSNGTYQNGQLVRYNNEVYEASSEDSSAVVGPDFDLANWTLVDAATYTYPGSNVATGLSGVDRTMGLYVPSVNQPGLELPLLIDGVDYPGVQVYGLGFLGDPALLDADYRSEFTDTTLGLGFSSINVDGGEFVGPYEGHAPEELVNGSEFDTLDFRVITRPGSDWNFDGHGFQLRAIRYTYDPAMLATYSWAGLVENYFQVLVANASTGLELYLGVDYTIDWVAQDISIVPTSFRVSLGDIINITVYELGGGSQLYRANYISDDINQAGGAQVIIPVNEAEIYEIAAFNDANPIVGITYSPYIDSTAWTITGMYLQNDVVNNIVTSVTHFYRAIQNVPVGVDINNTLYWIEFAPTLLTLVEFNQVFPTGHGVSLAVLGPTTPVQYSWSTPVVQLLVAQQNNVDTKIIDLDNFAGGTNPVNMIVIQNGLRMQPAAGIEWIGDDSSVQFGLPQRSGYSQEIINSGNDVTVYVNGIAQVQTEAGPESGDYLVTPWGGSEVPGRQVQFFEPPAAGARILIAVSTQADYVVFGNQLEIISPINLGDEFEIITWNDTQQQNIVTQVFKGPITTGITIDEPFDSTPFDSATVNGTPGSYDYSIGIGLPSNDFVLDPENSRGVIDPGRLWVTLDGAHLFEGEDYSIEGNQLILPTGAIGAAQVVVVTQFTNSIVPESMAFRIFQDMRGVQTTYRITAATTTSLALPCLQTDTVIFVTDASVLTEPSLENGIFGVITIDGERIMYRTRDLATNSLTSLLRGTAGTGAADHDAGVPVYDLGRGNLLFPEYQDYIVSDSTLGDGSTTVFYAPSIDIENTGDSSTVAAEAVEVYVGGVRQYAYSDITAQSEYRWFVTDFNPVAVEFVVDPMSFPELRAPAAGVEVTILVRRGVTWYAPGNGTPSDGVALQDTNTLAARFLRGL